MSLNVTTIGFDADDTLWHNERFFQLTQARFAGLLSEFCEATDLMEKLLQAEKRNIIKYGFGIKGFVLSMIETALEVTHNEVSGGVIAELIEALGVSSMKSSTEVAVRLEVPERVEELEGVGIFPPIAKVLFPAEALD